MKRMSRQQQPLFQRFRPTGPRPFEVRRAIARINFISHDRMAAVGEMHPDLMHSTGFGKTTDERKLSFGPLETPLDFKPRHAFPARWMNGLPEPDVGFGHFARPANRCIAT